MACELEHTCVVAARAASRQSLAAGYVSAVLDLMTACHDHDIVYRNSSIGSSLIDAMDELVQAGRVPIYLAMRVLNRFDEAVPCVLEQEAAGCEIGLKGSLQSYRSCDELWHFHLRNVEVAVYTGRTVSQRLNEHERTRVVAERLRIQAASRKVILAVRREREGLLDHHRHLLGEKSENGDEDD